MQKRHAGDMIDAKIQQSPCLCQCFIFIDVNVRGLLVGKNDVPGVRGSVRAVFEGHALGDHSEGQTIVGSLHLRESIDNILLEYLLKSPESREDIVTDFVAAIPVPPAPAALAITEEAVVSTPNQNSNERAKAAGNPSWDSSDTGKSHGKPPKKQQRDCF